MDARAEIWRAMEIDGGNSHVRGRPDFRRRCVHKNREQGYAIFLNTDGVRALVIAASNAATNFIAAEFRFVGNIPFRFPSAVRGDSRVALADNAAAVAFRDRPVDFGVTGNSEASVIRIAHQSFDLHGLARPIQIAVGDDFYLRFSSRPGVSTP